MNDENNETPTMLDSFPLSYAQQRLWFMTQLQGESNAYNLQWAVRIKGELSLDALQWSFNKIIARHEILRTRFAEQAGEPIQVIHPYREVQLKLLNLSELLFEERKRTMQTQLNNLSAQLYDLQKGPLYRIVLIQMQTQEHVLLINLHHIIADGWSVGIVAQELQAHYSTYLNKQVPPLAELDIQYADYACWQRELLSSQEQNIHQEYWLQQLANLPPLLIPTDHIRPRIESYQGKQLHFQLPASLNKPLADFCKHNRVTVFMTLLASFQLLLHRYSGQEEIVTGTVVAGRNRSELEGLIGVFVNTLVLRSDFSAQPHFTELLQGIKKMALAAFAHQDFPFEKLVEILQPERDMSKHPLFQVLFMLENAATPILALPGLELEPIPISTETAKFDLALSIREDSQGLQGTIEYNTSLFEQVTIERMAQQFQQLLHNILLTPDKNIAHIEYLPDIQRQQLLYDWNQTTEPYPYQSTIHQLFEQQALQTPDAIAVWFEQSTLSYTQLNQHANNLAWELINSEKNLADQVIAIYLPRTPDIIAAMLAILKVGATYLPIELSYPDEHIQFMLTDAGVYQILTLSSYAQKFSNFNGKLTFLDKTTQHPSITNPLQDVSSTQLAYILYTSGSTGRPKAVAVEHRNVVALLSAASKDFTDDDLQGVLAATTYSFDPSVLETFLPLTQGGRVILVENILQLINLPYSAQVKWVAGVPSSISELLNSTSIPASVQTVSMIGEPLIRELVDALYQQTNVSKVIDLYGPTETTIYSARCLRSPHHSPSIGRPIANTQLYILDAQLQPVGIGITAELHIAGAGVSRGYLNRSELNAEKFIANPFTAHNNGKLYKTGDLARYLVDGRIELLGRIDNQIKIRGYRIELGEITERLMQHPSIQDCHVRVNESEVTGKKILAYVIIRPQKKFSQQEIMTFLQVRLPEYMLPFAIISLNVFPKLANGKLDTAALPPVNLINKTKPKQTEQAANKLELHLLKTWEDILDRNDFGITDDFFILGGHSLLAVSLIDRVEKLFTTKLPLDSLWFDGGTVKGQAELIRVQASTNAQPQAVAIKSLGARPALFCLHTSGGNLFHYNPLSHCSELKQSLFGPQAQGTYDTLPPHSSVETIATHCIAAMQRQQIHGPYLLAGYSSGGIIAYEMAQQLAQMGEKTALLAMIDSYAPKELAGSFLSLVNKAFQDRAYLRLLQERIYCSVLNRLKLKHKRDLSQIGAAHRWANWVYQPKSYQGDIHLFRADDWQQYGNKPGLGWQQFIKGTLHIHPIATTHSMIIKPPYVHQLAEKLQACIDQLLSN